MAPHPCAVPVGRTMSTNVMLQVDDVEKVSKQAVSMR